MSRADKVVVIGGAGFIGSSLTRFLLDEGSTVVVTSRSAGTRKSDNPRLSYQSVSVSDSAGVSAVINGASVVYDLSMGFGATWEEHKKEAVDSAVSVARACQEHGVRRLVYTSSTAALYLAGSRTVTEKSGPDNKPEARSLYSRGKIEAELALLKLHAEEKFPVVIFRPAVVLGPGGKLVHGAFGETPLTADTCILGFGSGKTPLPCVLGDDVARALLLAKDKPGIDGMTFNLAGDVRPSVTEYVQWLRDATHRNFRFYPRSVWSLQAAEIAIFSLKSLLRKGKSKMNNSLRDLASAPLSAPLDCALAKNVLGWKPVSDVDEFRKQALLCHVQPLPAGDVRLETRR